MLVIGLVVGISSEQKCNLYRWYYPFGEDRHPANNDNCGEGSTVLSLGIYENHILLEMTT